MFLSLTGKAGRSLIFSTTGSLDTHVILRGGRRPELRYRVPSHESRGEMVSKRRPDVRTE